jgi:ABC-type Fe3+-siderophore transport system permease subunit
LRPAELPIGIVTSVVGVPVFLSLLRHRKYLA